MAKVRPKNAVYLIDSTGAGVPESRPFVSNADWPEEYGIDMHEMATGEVSVKKYRPLKLHTGDPHPQATDYDFYHNGLGLLSARAREVLEPFATEYFTFLDADLYGKPYYFLRIKKTLDGVLDVKRSDVYEDEGVIETVSHAVFLQGRVPDPCFFCIPEGLFSGPFATETVAKAIKKAKLKGIALKECG